MDYCSSCRRHLNGALVCPGCGAYAPDIAPDIAPATADGRRLPTSATTVTTSEAAAPEATHSWHDSGLRDEGAVRAGLDAAPQSDPSEDLADVPSTTEGRAARRRQRVRWKKNQRRAVVATAFALVGGGLTMAAMDRQSGDQAQAATAPQDPDMGTVEEPSVRDARPTAILPDAQRSSSTPAAQSPAPDHPHRQHTAASLPATPPSAQPEAATPPRRTALSAPQPKSTYPVSADTVPERTDTPHTTATQTQESAATDDTGGTKSTDSGTSQTSTTPTATSPSEVCLLVVCLPVSSS